MELEKRKVAIGSDHAGFNLKCTIKKYLEDSGKYSLVDVGTNSSDSCDFPDFGEKVCQEVLKGNATGIVICGSGIGISITANKIPGIRCALVHDHLTAKLARLHTNCNVVAFGESIVGPLVAKDIVDTFLETEMLKEEKYQKRIDKVSAIEKKYSG